MANDESAEVRRLLHAHGRAAGSVRLLGGGLDHAAYDVDDALVVRLARRGDLAAHAAEVEREGKLLAGVAASVPLSVPEPVITAPDRGCLVYAKLAGRPLLRASGYREHADRLGTALGGFLAALHRVPAGSVTDVVGVDRTPLAEWLADARVTYPAVRAHLPAEHRPAVEAFLVAAPPPDGEATVLAHNDLGIEHLLVDDDWRITGVIDWSDAALTDPARDFGKILRDLGPAALDAALAAYQPARWADDGGPGRLRERALFLGRCGALEDLAHGVEAGDDAYKVKTLTALPWLFPIHHSNEESAR